MSQRLPRERRANRAAREWVLAAAKFEHPVLRPLYVLSVTGMIVLRGLDLADMYALVGIPMALVEWSAAWFVAAFALVFSASMLGHGAQRAHFTANCCGWSAESAIIARGVTGQQRQKQAQVAWDAWGGVLRKLAYLAGLTSLVASIVAILAFPIAGLALIATGFRWTHKGSLKASASRMARFWKD